MAPPGQVLAVENSMRLSGHGPDDGGGNTEELLTTIYNRFGPVSSFTGTYQADVWRLNINRRNPDSSKCSDEPNTTMHPLQVNNLMISLQIAYQLHLNCQVSYSLSVNSADPYCCGRLHMHVWI